MFFYRQATRRNILLNTARSNLYSLTGKTSGLPIIELAAAPWLVDKGTVNGLDDHQSRTTKETNPHQDTIARPDPIEPQNIEPCGSQPSREDIKVDKQKNSGTHEQQRTGNANNKQKPNIWMTVLTGIIALATIGNVVIFYYASKDASEQTTRLINEAGKIAASIAETVTHAKTAMDASSKQSKAALDVTIANFHLEQRAWVGAILISPPEYTDGDRKVYVKEGQKFNIKVTITNSGKTPARKVRTFSATQGLKAGVDPFEYISSGKIKNIEPVDSLTVMQPGMVLYLTPPPTPLVGVATKNDIDNITSGQYVVYVTGIITYEDVFKKPHTTKFCVYLKPDLITFNSCEKHNEAD